MCGATSLFASGRDMLAGAMPWEVWPWHIGKVLRKGKGCPNAVVALRAKMGTYKYKRTEMATYTYRRKRMAACSKCWVCAGEANTEF